MAKKKNYNYGAPGLNGFGGSLNPKHVRVRYKGYSVEGSGSNPVKDMKRAGDNAIINLSQLKQMEINQDYGRRFGELILGKLFGTVASKNTEGPQEPKPLEEVPEKMSTGLSYAEMMARPMSCEDGVIAEGYILKGQITFCVAGADSGKSFIAIDTAIAAASGTVPTYLPSCSRPSERMNVLLYRLEERAGEMPKRYGEGRVFASLPIKWLFATDLLVPTQEGLIANIKGQCEMMSSDTLIIVDPLTKLDGFDANRFIKEMEALQTTASQKGHILSIFCTAHTAEAQPWKALTPDQIVGGDKLQQQAGSVFSIRVERRSIDHRFLQTLKPPKGEMTKDTVSVVRFVSRNPNDPASYTHLEYACEKSIEKALPMRLKAEEDGPTEAPKTSMEEQYLEEARAMKAYKDAGHTQAETAKKFGCSRGTYNNRMELLKQLGEM